MSPPDYDANLVPAPSLTPEFEAIPGYHETKVRAAFKARYSKAVEEVVRYSTYRFPMPICLDKRKFLCQDKSERVKHARGHSNGG